MNGFKYCANCDPDRTHRRRFGEGIARDCLAQAFPDEDGWNIVWGATGFGGDHSNRLDGFERDMGSNYRPDFILSNDSKYPGRVAYIEHDEEQHQSYNVPCDSKRTCEIIQWKTHDCPMLVGRVNPDAYKVDGGQKKVAGWRDGDVQDPGVIKARYERVIQDARDYFQTPLDDLISKPRVVYNLYYYNL